jgi:hypothetical protein
VHGGENKSTKDKCKNGGGQNGRKESLDPFAKKGFKTNGATLSKFFLQVIGDEITADYKKDIHTNKACLKTGKAQVKKQYRNN